MAIETLEEQGLNRQETRPEEPSFENILNSAEHEMTPELPSSGAAREARTNLLDVESLVEEYPESAEALRPHIDKVIGDVERAAKQEEIERLRAELNDLNRTVQKSDQLEIYGQKYGFNRDQTYSFIEERVKENEARIRELEVGGRVALAPGTEQEHEAQPEVSGGDNQPPEVRVGQAPAEMPEEEARKLPLKQQPLKFRFLEEENQEKVTPKTEQAREQAAERVTANVKAEQASEQKATNAQGYFPHGGILRQALDNFEQKKEHAESKGTKWSWVKERIKGFATFGINDFIQGGRFSLAKHKAGKEIAAQSVTLEKTEHLSLEDALKEAEAMKEMQRAAERQSMSKEDYEKFSKAVTARKEQVNNAVMKSITHDAMAKIEKRLEKYRNMGGVKVAQLEKNKLAFRDQLITELMHLQDGRKEIDVKKFEKIVQQSFDPKYWQRYVWGGVELALEGTGAALVMKTAAGLMAAKGSSAGYTITPEGVTLVPGHGATVGPGAKALMAGKHAVTGGMKAGTQGMNQSIWHTSKSILAQHGVLHPSNAQIMELSKQVAIDNHIGVSPWKLVGHPMDTHLVQGHMLKFSKAATHIVNKFAGLH